MSLGMNLGMMNPTVFGTSSPPENVVDALFRIARNTTKSVDQPAAITVNVVASRTSAAVPFGVTFDLLSNSTFPGISDPLTECVFITEFDDSGKEFSVIPVDHPFGRNANLSMGAVTGHVFDEVEDYTVRFYIYHPDSGGLGYQELTITGNDPDTVFAGSKTIFYSKDSDYTLAPVGAVTHNNLESALNAWNTIGDRRLQALGSEVSEQDFQIRYRRAGEHLFESVGTGRAKFTFTKDVSSNGYHYLQSPEYTFSNIEFEGNYNTQTGTGESAGTPIINYVPEFSGSFDFTVYKCKFTNMDTGVIGNDSGNKYSSGIVIQDCEFRDWFNFATYSSGVGLTVERGCVSLQDPNVVGGSGSKVYEEYTQAGDDSTTTVTHNVEIESDYANLAVFERNATTKTVVRELVLADGDYSNTDYTELEATVAAATGNEYFVHHRRWNKHGCSRTANITTHVVTHCDRLSTGGWFNNGNDIQPCHRANSGGAYDGALSLVNMSRMRGGYQVLHVGSDTPGDTVNPQRALFEQNVLYGDHQTTFGIGLFYGGSMARNNVIIVENQTRASTRKFKRAIEYGYYTGQAESEYGEPVRVYNNTCVNLLTAGNGLNHEFFAAGLGETSSPNAFPDYAEANNLIVAPHDPVTTHTDYTPIDANNYYALNAGSAGLDAGTHDLENVFDDFFGVARVSDTSIGASNTAKTATTVSISVQPANQSETAPDAATYSVTASGTGTLSYQWYLDGRMILGAESSSYTTGATVEGQTGNYSVNVIDDNGFIASDTATLTVNAATDDAPVLSGTFNIPDGVAGEAYNVDVSSLRTGGDAATGWALTGTPPTGASINSSGLITGTRVEETLAANSFGVKATNSGGDSNTLLDASGMTNTAAVARKVFVMDGVSAFATVTTRVLNPGDTASTWFRWDGATGVDQILFGYFGSSPKIDTSGGDLVFDSRYTIDIDGSPVTSGAWSPTVGVWYLLELECVSSTGDIRRVGNGSASNYFKGAFYDFSTIVSGVEVKYAMDSESTSESASVGTGTMTYTGGTWEDI